MPASRDRHDLATQTSTRPRSSPDGAVLTVLSGASKGDSLPLPGRVGDVVFVGKAEGNDLVVDDPTVSRRHFAIARTESGLELADEGSHNGVFVGGARIEKALVEPGTIFRAGDVEMMIAVALDDVVIPVSEHDQFGLAMGTSVEMRRIFGVLERMAPTNATVLLTGETGTGKDVLARSIHTASKRAGGPFEVVDCGAISASLVESELFGHERGAFTGAVAARAGAFERATGGTIFLDEIGELPLDLQPKLLRVLEAREYRRVGGQRSSPADVRVVAATTRDLAREVAAGRFRQDLYFRLAVVSVRVPALRDRRDDIPLLVERLLGREPTTLAVKPEVLAAFRAYDWPGNVRELRNVIERSEHMARAMGSSSLVLAEFPPRAPRDEIDGTLPSEFDDNMSYRDTRARFDAAFERRYVAWLLAREGGNISAAARRARMDRTYLTELIRRHDLDRKKS